MKNVEVLAREVQRPPLECSYCFAERWNDETVVWLPLRGGERRPYCANTCGRYVMLPRYRKRLFRLHRHEWFVNYDDVAVCLKCGKVDRDNAQ